MFVVALAARLDAREYTQLTVIPNGGGTVEAEGGIDCGDSCMALYRGNIGEVTLFASPNPGYVFDGWTGACAFAGANPECTINV